MSRGGRKADEMVCHSPALASSEASWVAGPVDCLQENLHTGSSCSVFHGQSSLHTASISHTSRSCHPPRTPQGLDSQLGTVTPALVSLAYFSWGPCAFCSVFPWVPSSRWWSRCSALAVGLVGEMVPKVLPTQGCGHFH